MIAVKRRPDTESNTRPQSMMAGGKESLQVRIPTTIKRQFKARAAIRGMEPHELFVEVWEHYERTRPKVTEQGE